MAIDLTAANTLGDVLRLRAHDAGDAARVYLRFEDQTWTFGETFREACRYAQLFLRHRTAATPLHVGLMLENRPEFVFAELGAALAGGAVVGLNPTRRGEHLARDLTHADCGMVVTESKLRPVLDEALLELPSKPVVWDADTTLAAALADLPAEDPNIEIPASALAVLVFTSGTTGAPKAVNRSHAPLVRLGQGAAHFMTQATERDVVYGAMPLFHSNAQILALSMSLIVGCQLALVRKFSKSRFLDDIRRYGCTLFNYVGSPMAYVMDTPERPDDADNPLRLAYGNEGPRQYIEAFARRFGCKVIDSYGASECGIAFQRTDTDPPGALGMPAPGTAILDDAGNECAVAEFDAEGRVRNPEAAIGEIVNLASSGAFEGYYKNPEATEQRSRGGRYYSGDLGYRDAAGYVYFAGRDVEWLRVDGENFLARPIEQILARHPDVFMVAVYGVPDPDAGDRVMATIVLRQGAGFSGRAFAEWIDAQPDLGPKWKPTFIRLATDLRRSETNKVLKRELQHEGVVCDDPVFMRGRGDQRFTPFDDAALGALRARFARAGNAHRAP